MRLIVISSPESFPEEITLWGEMFDAGLETLHLRKPGMAFNEVDTLLAKVPEKYRQNIVVHKHAELAEKYALKGAHFRLEELNKRKSQDNRTSSASFHIGDDPEMTKGADYVFLSPAFDSISKQGYKGRIVEMEECAARLGLPVIALGGITASNISALGTCFHGAAVLGYIWQDPEKAVKRFNKLLKVVNSW